MNSGASEFVIAENLVLFPFMQVSNSFPREYNDGVSTIDYSVMGGKVWHS